MEEKIEVGEYVRTDNGKIHKVIDIEKGSIKIKSLYKEWIGLCCIVKHSKQLIDLIEVGDYVNGKFVIATDNRINDNGEKVILIENYDEWTDDGVISNKDIKSIVTHEQFNSIKYEVI